MRFINKTKIISFLPQIVASLFLAGFVAYAWTEPAGAPPAGNVDAPINVGTAPQAKSGPLLIGGIFQAFSDAIFNGKVGIGTTDPQGLLDVGGGKLVVTNEILASVPFTVGPNNPSSAVNDPSFGYAPWGGLASVVTSNNGWATAVINSIFPITQYLKITGFGFSIPANAVIDGIKAEVERSGYSGYVYPKNAPTDAAVFLVKNGIVSGQGAASAAPWPQNDAYQTYGSPSAKWGITWTPADINSSNFGIAIAATGVIDDPDTDQTSVSIDHISITIYYQVPSSVRDVAKVSNVTIAGDGSISTNLNADKLDNLHASEIGRNGLYGMCTYEYPVGQNNCVRITTVLPPAYKTGSMAWCLAPGGGVHYQYGTADCACPAGYMIVKIPGVYGSGLASPGSVYTAFCYKN